MKNVKWFVYILKCKDDTLYTGITNNLKRRIDEHNNSKKGAKYTKARRPVELVYSCTAENKSEALKKEIKIKKLSRFDKVNLINSNKS